jgi:undecaprenyl-diphosphatase
MASEPAVAGPPLAVLAGAVGASRVHYPLDVMAGAVMGAAIGALTTRVWRRCRTAPRTFRRARTDAAWPPIRRARGVSVVVNPASASASGAVAEGVRRRLPQARVLGLDPGDDLPQALEAAAREADVLGMAGGDGSPAAAAEVAVERSLPLLALPAGTLNHLARGLRGAPRRCARGV